jgi:hypothetical protein
MQDQNRLSCLDPVSPVIPVEFLLLKSECSP